MVGLGNPGKEFVGTRHNVGAEAVALLAERHGGSLRPMRGQRASVAEVTMGRSRVALAVPTTYMNDSGSAVRPLVRRFGLTDLSQLVVVHDELDLPPGRLKVKIGEAPPGTTACGPCRPTFTMRVSSACASVSASPPTRPGAPIMCCADPPVRSVSCWLEPSSKQRRRSRS